MAREASPSSSSSSSVIILDGPPTTNKAIPSTQTQSRNKLNQHKPIQFHQTQKELERKRLNLNGTDRDRDGDSLSIKNKRIDQWIKNSQPNHHPNPHNTRRIRLSPPESIKRLINKGPPSDRRKESEVRRGEEKRLDPIQSANAATGSSKGKGKATLFLPPKINFDQLGDLSPERDLDRDQRESISQRASTSKLHPQNEYEPTGSYLAKKNKLDHGVQKDDLDSYHSRKRLKPSTNDDMEIDERRSLDKGKVGNGNENGNGIRASSSQIQCQSSSRNLNPSLSKRPSSSQSQSQSRTEPGSNQKSTLPSRSQPAINSSPASSSGNHSQSDDLMGDQPLSSRSNHHHPSSSTSPPTTSTPPPPLTGKSTQGGNSSRGLQGASTSSHQSHKAPVVDSISRPVAKASSSTSQHRNQSSSSSQQMQPRSAKGGPSSQIQNQIYPSTPNSNQPQDDSDDDSVIFLADGPPPKRPKASGIKAPPPPSSRKVAPREGKRPVKGKEFDPSESEKIEVDDEEEEELYNEKSALERKELQRKLDVLCLKQGSGRVILGPFSNKHLPSNWEPDPNSPRGIGVPDAVVLRKEPLDAPEKNGSNLKNHCHNDCCYYYRDRETGKSLLKDSWIEKAKTTILNKNGSYRLPPILFEGLERPTDKILKNQLGIKYPSDCKVHDNLTRKYEITECFHRPVSRMISNDLLTRIDLVVLKLENKGMGLMADQDVIKGTLVGIFSGEVLTLEENKEITRKELDRINQLEEAGKTKGLKDFIEYAYDLIQYPRE